MGFPYQPRLVSMVRKIEDDLQQYYQLNLLASTADHLITRAEAESLDGQPLESKSRAAVVMQTHGEDAFVGIVLDERLIEQLVSDSPTQYLHNGNLDPFCALAEEISHFHLITQRLDQGRGVSRIELEWQAEMDKMIICAATLERQSGDPHILPLIRCLFDQSSILADQDRLSYEEANRVAGRLWHALSDQIARIGLRETAGQLQNLLRTTYHHPWQEKCEAVEDFRISLSRLAA